MAKGFVKGVKGELKKVVWPTKDQLIKTTGMVVLLIVVFAVVILGMDVILRFADNKLWTFIQNKVG